MTARRLINVLVPVLLLAARVSAAQDAATRPSRAASQPAGLQSGDYIRQLELDGRTRSYLIHVPPKFDPKRPTPVVLIFHGAMMNGQAMVWFSGMNKKSNEAGFVAVYPNGKALAEVHNRCRKPN